MADRGRVFAGEIDAVGVVDEMVEDGVGIGRIAEHDGTPIVRATVRVGSGTSPVDHRLQSLRQLFGEKPKISICDTSRR
jgi:hypothetical protein